MACAALEAFMSHYRSAPGKPPCKKGHECKFKQPLHWQSFNHPDDHPKLLRRQTANTSNGEVRDRSNCALEARTGDDPSTATYKCAGCGELIVGYGRWRNHMKRSKQAQGQRAKQRVIKGSSAPFCPPPKRGEAAAAAAAPQLNEEGEVDERLLLVDRFMASDDDKEEEAEEEEQQDEDDEEKEKEEVAMERPAATNKKVGKRWLGEAGKSGKRQRKFF